MKLNVEPKIENWTIKMLKSRIYISEMRDSKVKRGATRVILHTVDDRNETDP